jgi:ankyrin repeat protein
VVLLLLEKGADVAAKMNDGSTALHRVAASKLDRATGCRHEAVVLLLLEKGVDIAAKDDDRSTALQRAAEGGHEKVVQLLTLRTRSHERMLTISPVLPL